MTAPTPPHPWRFARLGGFDQVRLETAQDYARLGDLDQKLWAALACPVKGLDLDERTLSLVDTDGDGRVRAPEVIAAVRWAGARLVDLAVLREGSESLPLARISDPALVASAKAILRAHGRAGADAITLADVADAPDYGEAAALVAWADASVLPLGEGTAAAADAWKAVKAKVDDYFARCRMAAFDPRALGALNRREDEYLVLAAKDLSISSAEVAAFPIARVEAGRPLPLVDGVNPAWAGPLAALRTAVVAPVLGKDKTSLTDAEWADLSAKLAPFEAWRGAKPAAAAEKLGIPRLREILAGGEAPAAADVERLIRYHRDLHRLLVNFVNFSDFYTRARPSTFQAGTLYLDGRACELCVRVEDAGKHAALAGFAKAYLAYCACTRPSGETMTIAAAYTGGDSDYLMVGRNGVFYDRKGKDWDATITRVVENPISIQQAFWFPYKKLVRMIEEMVAKRAAAAEAEHQPDPTKKAPEPKKIDVGTVAAIGVAVGALGTLLATLAGYAAGLLTLPFWKLCLAIGGLLLLVSLPSMLIAWLKLRQRNLAPILDANGWAVNGRVKLSVRFGRSLTSVAALPAGTLPGADDPLADRPTPWPKVFLAVILACFIYSVFNSQGLVHRWTDGKFGDDPAAKTEKAGK